MVAMTRFEKDGGEQSYEAKMKKVLTDLTATPSTRGGKNWDLTEKVCRNARVIIDEIVAKDEMTENTAKWLKLKECHAPRLLGYHKVHNADVPFRGVVSTIGSSYDRISKQLVPILRKLRRRTGLFFKNSSELKEKVRHWRK